MSDKQKCWKIGTKQPRKLHLRKRYALELERQRKTEKDIELINAGHDDEEICAT